MQIVYILQIITIIVSVVNIAMTMLVSIYTNRVQNIAKTIANQRLKFLQEYREKSSELLTLCSPRLLCECHDFDTVRNIVLVSYELKNIFKGCYPEERRILEQIDNVVECALLYKDNMELENELNHSILTLYNLINIYDLAYWRFIIDQTSGSKYKVDDFDSYYKEAEKRYKEIDNH